MVVEKAFEPIPAGELIDRRYRVVSVIGKGAMGTIYEVRDLLEEGRILALKHFHLQESAARLKLFDEFSVLARLRHPHLVRVYDFGVGRERNFPYYTAQLVEGKSLTSYAGTLDADGLRNVAAKMLRVLGYLHDRGVVHYDVKPDNVIVRGDGEDMDVCLVDFGLAMDEPRKQSAGTRGSLPYMAPELLDGESSDYRADLYSLGCLLYHMVKGVPPFGGGQSTVSDLVEGHLRGEHGELPADTPHDIRMVISELMARNPASRPGHAANAFGLLDIGEPFDTDDNLESYYTASRLIGKSKELKAIETMLAGNTDAWATLLLGGEGTGRTRLQYESERLSQFLGYRVLRLIPGEGLWAGVTGLVRQMVPFVSGEIIRLHGSAYSESIALTADAIPMAITDEQEIRERRLDVAIIFLGNMLRKGKILINCDNADQLDEFSQGFITRVFRELGRRGMFRVGKQMRLLISAQPDIPLDDWPEDHLQMLSLGGLNDEQTIDMVRSLVGSIRLDNAARQRIVELSMGIPGMVEELVRQCLVQGIFRRTEGSGKWLVDATRLHQLTLDLAASVSDRLSELPLLTRDFADLVALSRIPFALNWGAQICRMAKLDADDGVKALEHLEMLGIIVRTHEGWRCASELLRKEIIHRLPVERRVRLHSILATMFSGLGPEYAAEQGYHLEYSGALEPAARSYLDAARYDRRTHAYENARNHSVQALQLEEMLNKPSRTRASEALAIIADVLMLATRAGEAIDTLDAWIKKFDWKPVQRAKLLWWKAIAHRQVGQEAAAKKMLQRALELMEDSNADDGWLTVRIHDRLADVELKGGDLAKAKFHAEKSHEAAQATDDAELVCRSLNALGLIISEQGDTAASIELLNRAVEMAAENELRNLEANYLSNLAGRESSIGNLEKARHLYERAQGIAKRFRFGYIELMVSNNLGDLLLTEGRHAEAAVHFEETYHASRRVNQKRNEAIAVYNIGFNSIFLGRFDAAIANLEKARELGKELGFKLLEAFSIQDMTWLYTRFGMDADLRRVRSRATSITKQTDNPAVKGKFELTIGLCDKAKNDHASALGHFKAAMEAFQPDAAPMEYAETLLCAWEAAVEVAPDEVADLESALEQHLLQHNHERIRLTWELRRFEQAESVENLERLERLCQKLEKEELLELAWQAHGFAAETYISRNDHASAYGHLVKGAKQIFKISDTFHDLVARSTYFKQKRALVLLAEYARLTSDESKNIKRDESIRFKLFGEFLKLFNSVFDFDTLVRHIVDIALLLTGAERGFMLLYNNDGRLETKTARSNDRDLTSEQFSIPSSLVQHIVEASGPVYFRDLTRDGKLASAESIRALKLRSAIGVPLVMGGNMQLAGPDRRRGAAGDRKLGILYVDSRQTVSRLSQDDIAIMGSIARLAVIAFMNLKLYREATTDTLTGLFLRRTFDTFLSDNIHSSTLDGSPMTLLMVDIDHFKMVNDEHGHQTGDQVLVKLADIMQQSFRTEDLVCRFGGEEFSVVLPRTTSDTAYKVAERLRKRVEQTPFACGRITISIGLAEWRHGEQAADLLARSDLALYAAKESGRNRMIKYALGLEKTTQLPQTATLLTGDPIRDQENLTALLRVVERSSSAESSGEMAELVLDNALQISGATRAMLFALGEDHSPVLLHWKRRGDLKAQTAGPYSAQAIRRVIKERVPVVILDVDESPDSSASMMALDLKSVVVVPVIHQKELVGIFYVDSPARTRKLGANDMLFLRTLAGTTARFVDMDRNRILKGKHIPTKDASPVKTPSRQ